MAQRENGTEVVEPSTDAPHDPEATQASAWEPDDQAWEASAFGRPDSEGGSSLYRPATDARSEAVRQEQERLAAERLARREARQAALNPQPLPPAEATQVQASAVPAPVAVAPARRTTDKFLPSLGLFVLRLVVAAIMGIHGLDKLLNTQRASEVFASTILPQPQLLTLVVGVAEVGIAIALVFGLLTRVAGLGVVLIAGGALAFVLWGAWSPFVAGRPGFIGELELLLVGAGFLLLCTGAGGWAVDRGFRARRTADRG